MATKKDSPEGIHEVPVTAEALYGEPVERPYAEAVTETHRKVLASAGQEPS